MDTVDGQILLSLARQSLRAALLGDTPSPEVGSYPSWLQEPGACFVTLALDGRLRGCLGSLEARQSLFEDLCHNAVAAATQDPRFSPLAAEEVPRVRMEVTVLGHPQPLTFDDEEDLLAQLRPGIDGVVLRLGPRMATFLPQVWESLPRPADFLQQLKLKAGWSADFWHPGLEVSRYSVQKWQETPGVPGAPGPAD